MTEEPLDQDKVLEQLTLEAEQRWQQKTPQQHATEALGREATPAETDFLDKMGLL